MGSLPIENYETAKFTDCIRTRVPKFHIQTSRCLLSDHHRLLLTEQVQGNARCIGNNEIPNTEVPDDVQSLKTVSEQSVLQCPALDSGSFNRNITNTS